MLPLLIYSDDINYNPDHPTSYNGALISVKNQIALRVESATPSAACFIRAGNWSDASNWKNSLLPSADDMVYINAPCQLDQDATVAELYVYDGQSLTLQSGKTLTVTDTLNTYFNDSSLSTTDGSRSGGYAVRLIRIVQ